MTAPDKIVDLTDQDRANIIAHLSPELTPSGPLPSPNSVMMDWVYLRNALDDRDATIARLQARLDAGPTLEQLREWQHCSDCPDCRGCITETANRMEALNDR